MRIDTVLDRRPVGTTAALPHGYSVGGAKTLCRNDFEVDRFPLATDGSPGRDPTEPARLDVHDRIVAVSGFGPRGCAATEERT